MTEKAFPGAGRRVALTIAGLDPSCGAGITADLKTFAAYGLYGICCATAITVQSTRGVKSVHPLEPALIAETLACLEEDTPAAGIKIGMLGTAAAVLATADFLEQISTPRDAIVLDPVIRSSSGAALLDTQGVAILRTRLLGQVGWITPNVDELAALLGEPVAGVDGIPGQAERLQQMARSVGNRSLCVVVTGGHLDPPNDYFLAASGTGGWIPGERVQTTSTHGTGCAFSSALLCQLLSGSQGSDAVRQAKAYVTEALLHAYPVGTGKGPLHHLFRFDI